MNLKYCACGCGQLIPAADHRTKYARPCSDRIREERKKKDLVALRAIQVEERKIYAEKAEIVPYQRKEMSKEEEARLDAEQSRFNRASKDAIAAQRAALNQDLLTARFMVGGIVPIYSTGYAPAVVEYQPPKRAAKVPEVTAWIERTGKGRRDREV